MEEYQQKNYECDERVLEIFSDSLRIRKENKRKTKIIEQTREEKHIFSGGVWKIKETFPS